MAIRKQKEPKMANDDKPRNAEFIERVVGDPANPPQTRLLTGWFGAAADEGYRRLYTDPELSSYVDIPEEAILHSEPIRDAQPAGGVLVWIKADAAIKQGGTTASRAGRFLQGQVAQDFSSPQKLGYRCVTQVPCGEPTGFTGQCTKQPEVGGGWPCLTALPLCSAEPTGFTGQCTHQPWPNPTRYAGCTVVHCPTNDLTQQPHVCQIVESGMPGCGQAPPQPQTEGEGGEGEEAAGAARRPVTMLPGCGYTQWWGLCKTHMLYCQPSVQIPCITQDLACAITRNPAECLQTEGAQGGGVDEQFGGPGSFPTITGPSCPLTRMPGCIAPTIREPRCFPPLITRHAAICFNRPTRDPRCFPIPSPFCPVTPGCPIGPIDPRVRFDARGGQFGAGAGAAADPAIITNPSAVDACPTRFRCDTQPPTQFCTQIPEECPTYCGGGCQTPQPGCTSLNCTHAGPQCPDPSIGIACTALPPQCPRETNVQLDCTFGCTQFGVNCGVQVTNDPACNQVGAAQFGAPGGGAHITLLTIPQWACAPTPATRCFICPPLKTRQPWLCPPRTLTPEQCPTLGIACTAVQCGWGGGGGGGQTAATTCTQFGQQCQSAVDACPTRLCDLQFGAQNTAATTCTQFGHQCQSAVDACPTRLCDTRFGCGGQTAATTCTQFGHQCQSAVDACPTRLCDQQFGAVQGGIWPTPLTRCFVC